MTNPHEAQIEILTASAAMWRSAERLHGARMRLACRPDMTHDERDAMTMAIKLAELALESMRRYLNETVAMEAKETAALG